MKIAVRSPHHLNTPIKSKKLFEEIKKKIKIVKLLSSDRLMLHLGNILPKLELDYKTTKRYKGKKREEFNISKKEMQKQFKQLIINLKRVVELANKNKNCIRE